MTGSLVRLRKMALEDLPTVEEWLAEPHVSRWYLAGSSVEQEADDLRRSVTGAQAVNAMVVVHAGDPIGWCQWYLCDDDPDWGQEIGAGPGDVGIDYAIGTAACVGRGIGTALIAEVVRRVRARHPAASIFADPDEHNIASRRVLEKNGFELVGVKPIASELTDDPMAIYRLSASGRWTRARSRSRSR